LLSAKFVFTAPMTGTVDFMCPKFQVYKDTASKTHFRLRADNNQIVAVGEVYEQHQECIKTITSIINAHNAPIDDLTVKGNGRTGNLKFEVYYDAENKIRFRLRASDGAVIAQGEAYDTKTACLKGIQVVRCCYLASVESPFVTEIVLDTEIPRISDITIGVVKPPSVVIRLGDKTEKRAPLQVLSLFNLLGLEFALGLTEGILDAVGKSGEAAVESAAASIQ
jgi:uncharacterized protein